MLERGSELWLADGLTEDSREDEEDEEGNGADDFALLLVSRVDGIQLVSNNLSSE